MSVTLQQILGVDKRNPNFTLCRDSSGQRPNIHVYFGSALLEVVPEDQDYPEFKLLVARLYNANVNSRKLTQYLGPARTAIKRWGDTLKSGDADQLINALCDQGLPLPKKLCIW